MQTARQAASSSTPLWCIASARDGTSVRAPMAIPSYLPVPVAAREWQSRGRQPQPLNNVNGRSVTVLKDSESAAAASSPGFLARP